MQSLPLFSVISMNVKLQGHTPDPEAFMAHVARVSNPANQSNPDYERLLGYCIRHGHWSVFEHASMTLEIVTTLDVATQILRHRSFCFQQLSRRYAGEEQAPVTWVMPQLRAPHPKDRQASLDTLDPGVARHWQGEIQSQLVAAHHLYRRLLAAGIARECARAVLPQATTTTLYMTGNCRSWIHYIALRGQPDTQAEHRAVAREAQVVFRAVFPTCAAALDRHGWTDRARKAAGGDLAQRQADTRQEEGNRIVGPIDYWSAECSGRDESERMRP